MSSGTRDEGTQAAKPETPREGKIGGGDVAFVHQLAANATAQSIVVAFDFRLFAEADLGRALRAVRANARHGQLALDRVILAQAREVDVQVILETTYHHREDAGEVLAFGDGMGSLLQQAQPAELVERLALGQLARGRLGTQRRIGFFQIRGSLADAVFQRFVDAREDVLHAHPARRVDRAHLRDREKEKEAVRKSTGMRQHRSTICRRLRIQHGEVADNGEHREQYDHRSQTFGSAQAPVEDSHEQRQEGHQRQRRAGNAEPGRRRVWRDGVEDQEQYNTKDQQTGGERRSCVPGLLAQRVGRAQTDRQHVRRGRPRDRSQQSGKSRGVDGIPREFQRGKHVDELEHRIDADRHGDQAREMVVGAPTHVPQQHGHDAAHHDDAGVEEGVQVGRLIRGRNEDGHRARGEERDLHK